MTQLHIANFPCECYYIGKLIYSKLIGSKFHLHSRVIYSLIPMLSKSYIVSVIIEYFCYWLNYYWEKVEGGIYIWYENVLYGTTINNNWIACNIVRQYLKQY